MSKDTDFFGFTALPDNIRLIHGYKIKNQNHSKSAALHLKFRTIGDFWNSLKLMTNRQRLQLISLCGNGVTEKFDKEQILKKCRRTGTLTKPVDKLLDEIEAKKKDFLKVLSGCIAKSENFVVNNDINAFYKLSSQKIRDWKPDKMFNVRWKKLQMSQCFSGGLFPHDHETYGYTIHERLAPLRHAIFYRHGMKTVEEYLAVYATHPSKPEKARSLKFYEFRSFDLERIQHDVMDLKVRLVRPKAGSACADIHELVPVVVDILEKRRWIPELHCQMLLLQYLLKQNGELSRQDDGFRKAYAKFKEEGLPDVAAYTAQWLFVECCRLICWNYWYILPHIHDLIDGPLFHFLCKIMKERRGPRIQSSLWNTWRPRFSGIRGLSPTLSHGVSTTVIKPGKE